MAPIVPQGPSWSSADHLKTHVVSKYFKPEFRPTGVMRVALVPLYVFGMVSYAFATVWRIIGLVKDILYFLGTLLVALFSFGYLANCNHIKKRGFNLLISTGEVGIGILGIFCPPAAVYLDEKIQSSMKATSGTFPWNAERARGTNWCFECNFVNQRNAGPGPAANPRRNSLGGNIGVGNAWDAPVDPVVSVIENDSMRQIDIDRDKRAKKLIDGQLSQFRNRVNAANVYFKRFNSEHDIIVYTADLEKNIALALAILCLDKKPLKLPNMDDKTRVNYEVNLETRKRLDKFRDLDKRDLLLNFIAAELIKENSADRTIFAEDDQHDLNPIMDHLKNIAKNIMLLNNVTAALYKGISG